MWGFYHTFFDGAGAEGAVTDPEMEWEEVPELVVEDLVEVAVVENLVKEL